MDATQTLIDRARAYLDARRGERTTLEELGRAVGASPFHLQRSFKRVLGSPRATTSRHCGSRTRSERWPAAAA